MTVFFANGKINVDPGYRPKLVALAGKANTVNGYIIEVKGFASSPGSAALNQQLSEDRAEQVVNILIQEGHIPLTRMLAPGAMVNWYVICVSRPTYWSVVGAASEVSVPDQ